MYSDFRVSSITPEQRVAARKGPIRLGEKTVHLVPTDNQRCSVGDVGLGTHITCVFFDGDACPRNLVNCPTSEIWLTEPNFVRHLKNQLTSA